MKKNVILRSFKTIFRYLNRREKKRALGLFVLLLSTSLLDVFGLASIIPVIKIASDHSVIESNRYLAMVYDLTGADTPEAFLLILISGLLVFFITKNLYILYVNYKQADFIADVTVNMVDHEYRKYTNLNFWNFKNLGSSKIMNLVNQTPSYFSSYLMKPLLLLMSEMMIVVFIIVGIAIYQPILFIILASVLAPTTVIIYYMLKDRKKAVGDAIDELRPISYNLINDTFAGYIDLKLAGKQKVFKERYMKVKRKTQDLNVLSNIYNSIPQRAIETIAVLGIVIIFIYSLLLSSQPGNILTLLGLFVVAAYRLMPSINRILSSTMMIKEHQFTIENLELMSDDNVKEDIDNRQQNIAFKEAIEAKEIEFSFPDSDENVLQDLSFRVNKGEKVGFIGSSGSGKTTLLNILLRFYTENAGSLKVDGEAIDSSNIKSWRSLIGYVKQDVFLMANTIKENITLCQNESEIDYDRLNSAVDKASLRSFINGLSEGLETVINENGSNVSGGQRQRIGIARALYHDAEILIFDEATSALDNETEREVTEAINRLSHTDITLLIVAHRITTLKDCDRIFELESGRIIGEHRYEDVITSVI